MTKTKKLRGHDLPQIYSVVFANPLKPGYWSEPLGRFLKKSAASEWAQGYEHSVVLEVLMKDEPLRLSTPRTLAKLLVPIKEAYAKAAVYARQS